MRPFPLALAGLAAYAVFLLATVPAAFVAHHLPDAPALRVEVHEALGTIWRGRARATLVPRGGAPIVLDSLAWHWLPARLASGRLAFDAHAVSGGATATLEAARTWSAWQASRVQARAPAAMLAPLHPLAATWQPGGEVVLEAPALRWDGREATGEARIEWRDATLALSDVRPLGTYRVDWRGEGATGRLSLATSSGPLRLSGQGTTTPHVGLAFSGEARVDAAAARDLERLLDLLGPRRPDGARAIELRLR